MPQADGYCLLGPTDLPNIEPVLARCRELFEHKLWVEGLEGHGSETTGIERDGQLKVRSDKREHLRNLLTNEDLRNNPILLDFALSDTVLKTAVGYLGTIPHLNRLDLLYSVPRLEGDNVASQLYHVDPEGLTQVKFFINVYDVGEAEGPFTFLPAAATLRVIRDVGALRRRRGAPKAGRYLDEEVAAVGADSFVVRAAGPAGAGVAVDTSRCLHMGSRVESGAFRLCLYLQYCTTRELGNVFDVSRYASDPVRYLAVQQSVASAGVAVSAPHRPADSASR